VVDRHRRLSFRGWPRLGVPGLARVRERWRLPGSRRASGQPGDDTWAWLEPFPGPFTERSAPSMSLAFVSALQRLPPGERAALILSDVLGFGAGEVAEILGCAPEAVGPLLARARAGVAGVLPRPEPHDEDAVVSRFAGAFGRGDVAGIAALLTDDARLRMRPLPVEYHGRTAARHFIGAVAFPGGTTRYRLVVTRANGQPAFGCYLRDPSAGIDRACGLLVLTVDGDRIAAIDRFVDNSALPRFGLPRTLPGD
jgi:RNA polymerase sigma-70 factor, ECF subfamily